MRRKPPTAVPPRSACGCSPQWFSSPGSSTQQQPAPSSSESWETAPCCGAVDVCRIRRRELHFALASALPGPSAASDQRARSAYEEGIEELSELYYRGYVPFLINPDYYWTYGSVAVSDLEDISRTATQIAAGDSQAQARYCAVLFDKAVAPLRDRSGQPLQGSDPSKLGTPAFTSERFDVYLLGHRDRCWLVTHLEFRHGAGSLWRPCPRVPRTDVGVHAHVTPGQWEPRDPHFTEEFVDHIDDFGSVVDVFVAHQLGVRGLFWMR